MGNVGEKVVATLLERADAFREQTGASLTLRRVAVKDPTRSRGIDLPAGVLTGDASDVLDDPSVDVVVEVIGGDGAAGNYVRRALTGGKHVVSANKELVAKAGPELFELARANGAALRFEASVGGGIPVISPLLRDLPANRVVAIRAIINGTTNFILTNMAQRGDSFEDALAEAQDLGYAEPDPTNDVDGYDAAFKIALMAGLAFGTYVRPEEVATEGIRSLAPQDIEYARELGYVIKLLAIAERHEDGVLARVHPALLPESEPLARVDGVQNAAQIQGDLAGTLTFQGAGAGAAPTTSAVLADVLDISRSLAEGAQPRWDPGPWRNGEALGLGALETRYYLRMTVVDQPGVLAQIARVLGEAKVSIAAVDQRESDEERGTAELALMTHRARELAVTGAIDTLRELDEVIEVNAMLRVEGAT
ncbi:MAG: homoserine dehydrogenase [Dehalococcoidia bacterium]|nr:homoserine dehydrogenase [Dehalococcoidia bacterium]MYD29172.1 homoserine dehydrogenase [Dehalococcoidia bacterium]